MKNLQKVLALGLALVMILGMFTFASAAEIKTASDFTDWDKVEHKDAVALCVDLGIINGMPDGSFSPEKNIDRAAWAKLVYFTATGDDNADAYLGTATDLTDITGNWAESYISYLRAMNWVAGDGSGKYNPKGSITVAAGLKTMLAVLGWDADARGYQNVGSAWAANVITDAKRNGLMDDIDRKNTANVELTRDNAAQIIYNTLMAGTVTTETGRDNGEKYVSKHEATGKTLGYDVFSIMPVTATVKSVNNDGIATFEDVDSTGITGTVKLDNVKASSTVVGETVTVFVKVKGSNKAFDKVVSTSVAKAANSAAATFTGGVDLDDVTNSSKDDYVADAPAEGTAIQYFLNGGTSTEAAVKAVAVAGNTIEVYTKDNVVSMIKATTYTVKKISAAAETRTRNDVLQVRIMPVTGWVAASKVTGYQGLDEGDIVLVNEDTNGNFTIEKAEKVTGKVTLKKGAEGAELTINGSKYTESGIAVTGDNAPGFDSWDVAGEKANEYDFYLDKNGTVCYLVQVSGEVTKDVAYVLQCQEFETNATGLANAGTSKVEAELLFTDGTTQIVTVAKIGDVEMDADTGVDTAIGTVSSGAFVDYSVNSKGNYELTVKDGAESKVTGSEVAAKPKFTGTLTANNKTVFLIAKGNDEDGYEYSVVTGYADLPAMPTTAETQPIVDGVVTYAFIKTPNFTGEGSDGLIYIKATNGYVESADGRVYDIVDAEGSDTTLAIDTEENLAPGFYSVTSVTDGMATVAKDNTEGKTIEKIGNSIVKLADTDAMSYDKSTVCVVIDIDEDGNVEGSVFSPDNFEVDDGTSYTYSAILLGDGPADYIYVVRTAVGDQA